MLVPSHAFCGAGAPAMRIRPTGPLKEHQSPFTVNDLLRASSSHRYFFKNYFQPHGGNLKGPLYAGKPVLAFVVPAFVPSVHDFARDVLNHLDALYFGLALWTGHALYAPTSLR